MEPSPFPNWLRGQIERSGQTQSAVARQCRVSDSAVSEWARGRRTPDPMYCWRLAEIFGVEVLRVMQIAGHLPPDSSVRESPPKWLEEAMPLLRQMDGAEGAVLEAMARALLKMRDA